MRRIVTISLLSSLALSAAAAYASPASDASVPSTNRPVSTGVTSPRLVYSTKINIPATELPANSSIPAEVTLQFNLDQTGAPQGIQIVRSINPSVDARVIEAVRQFRWTPAVLDHQAVPIEFTFTVQVQRSVN